VEQGCVEIVEMLSQRFSAGHSPRIEQRMFRQLIPQFVRQAFEPAGHFRIGSISKHSQRNQLLKPPAKFFGYLFVRESGNPLGYFSVVFEFDVPLTRFTLLAFPVRIFLLENSHFLSTFP
jgi:hypothetical protein